MENSVRFLDRGWFKAAWGTRPTSAEALTWLMEHEAVVTQGLVEGAVPFRSRPASPSPASAPPA